MARYFVLVTLLIFPFISHAATLSGLVIGVTDGDTITVLDNTKNQHKIRLAGIDAPEKKQPFGNVSKKGLSDLVYDKQVNVDWHKEDRYGRKVGKVLVDGVDANLMQIKQGLAWYYKKYKSELAQADRIDYVQAQQAAEDKKLGLWVDENPIPPWDFRKQ